jgi:hypothetical protein
VRAALLWCMAGVAACSSHAAAQHADAAREKTVDGSSGSLVDSAPEPAFDGGFPCGDQVCNKETQFCFKVIGPVDPSVGCTTFLPHCVTCACVQMDCGCTDQDGGVTVSCGE